MEVVKESLGAGQDKGANAAWFDTWPGGVDKGKGRVRCAAATARAELRGGKGLETIGIQQDSLCHGLLPEFATALEEGDRPAGLVQAVVVFAQLRDGDCSSAVPGMVAEGGHCIKERREA